MDVPTEKLSPHWVFTRHLAIIFCLAAGHLVATILLRESAPFSQPKLRALFDLDAELGIGTYFSAIGLLACACAAWLVSRAESDRATRRFWGAAALLAAFLSLDEAIGIHEHFAALAGLFAPATGIFRWSWWIAYVAALAPVLGLMAPGLMKLEPRTRTRLIVAGVVFVVGAVGFEILDSVNANHMLALRGIREDAALDWAALRPSIDADASFQRQTSEFVLGEEILEMLGVALALRALLMRAAELRATLGFEAYGAARRPGQAQGSRGDSGAAHA